MTRVRFLAVLLALLTPLAAYGQEAAIAATLALDSLAEGAPDRAAGRAETPWLTLDALEDLAFQHNPTLATAAARMAAARGRQTQAGLYPNPIVGYHATEIGNLGTAGQQGAFVNQRLITGGKRGLDQAIAGKEIDEAHFRLHAQQRRVVSDVRVQYYNALVAQRRVALTEELARIGEALSVATGKLVNVRLRTENDLLQAEIRSDESQILLGNARNERDEAWRRLAAVVGLPNLPMRPLAGELDDELPNLDWHACSAMVLANNFELNAARARADRASIAVRRARKEPVPNVDVSVSVRHHNVSSDDVANVQLGVPLPLFDRNQGNIRSAEAQWIAACQEVKRIELDLQDRLAVAYRRFANARLQTERYRDRMIPRAQRSLDLVSKGYAEGQANYLTILNAQQTYVHVNLSYLDALRELRAAAALLEGQLLSGSLTNPL